MSDEQDHAEPRASTPNVAVAYPNQPSNTMRRITLLLPFVLLFAYLALRKQNPRTIEEGLEESNVNSSKSEDTPGSGLGSAPRIAVCYSGHVGTFEKVYEQNVAKFENLTSVPISYFFVIDLKDDYKDARKGSHYTKNHEIGSLQPIFDKLSARAIETYSSSETTKSRADDDSCVGDHAPVQDDAGHYSQSYATLHAAERCYQLVRNDEERTGDRYDWIVRLRPDMQIAIKLPPAGTEPRVHMSGTALALIPRVQADDYFSAVNAFDKDTCKELQDMDDGVCKNYAYEGDSSECLLIKWLKRKDIVPSNGVYVNRRIVYPE